MQMPARLQKYLQGHDHDETFLFTPAGTRIRREFYAPSHRHSQGNWPLEDLLEWRDLLEAIENSGHIFTMVELGAGYGRWVVAAAVLAQRVRGMSARLIAVEAEPFHFEMMRQHFIDNGVNPEAHTLLKAAGTETDGLVYFVEGHSREWYGQAVLPSPDHGFGNWPEASVKTVQGLSLVTILRDLDLVDLIDMDVQGAEAAILRGNKDILCERVKRLHIGTHSHEIEAELIALFEGMGNWTCLVNYACYSTAKTEFGEIKFLDGVQTWVNSALT